MIERLKTKKQQLRKWGLSVAIVFFLVGLGVAARHADIDRINWPLLLLYLVFFPPFGLVIQALDLRIAAKASGTSFSWREAAEIVVYSRAATLLPIPGGYLTRIAAFKAKGISVARSSLVVLLFTAMFGTVAFAYAGAWMTFQQPLVGSILLLIALSGALVTAILSMKAQVKLNILAQGAVVRLIGVIFETVILVLAFAIVGAQVGFDQSATMVISGFVGLMINIVPAGIGIREAVVALMAHFVGLAPAIGFIAASITRVVNFTWMICLASAILLGSKKNAIP